MRRQVGVAVQQLPCCPGAGTYISLRMKILYREHHSSKSRSDASLIPRDISCDGNYPELTGTLVSVSYRVHCDEYQLLWMNRT